MTLKGCFQSGRDGDIIVHGTDRSIAAVIIRQAEFNCFHGIGRRAHYATCTAGTFSYRVEVFIFTVSYFLPRLIPIGHEVPVSTPGSILWSETNRVFGWQYLRSGLKYANRYEKGCRAG